MDLEKMGLPPKPYEKGKDWTPDSTNCEGCQAAFTWINRKHHCRRCGGLFCNTCTPGRVYLRGQGDAPARVCDPCKQIEEAAKLERKAPRGESKASSKDDGTEAVLKQILKPNGMAQADEVNSESILAGVTDTESDDHELASPSRVDDDDLNDPEMDAALRAMGWEEEAAGLERTSKPQPKVTKPNLKEQVVARKMKALALNREGKIAEARAELAEAKKLEQQLENPGGDVTTTSTIPIQVSELVLDEIEEAEEKVEVTDEDMRDPEMMAALRAMGFGDDEPAPSQEIVTPVAKPNEQGWSALQEDGIEKKDEDRGGDFEDPKELSGEGPEYDAEAQQSMPCSERRKHKRLEVYVGGLDKDTTEEELKSLFEKVGEVVQVRLMRNPQTGRNKGYAFIRYASAAMAKRAAEELGTIEIRGRACTAKPSEENDTLYLGNINKSWKKEMVLETLKSFSIENIEELTLSEDTQVEGVNRGYAFIEFGTHKDALEAFRRLQQPDAIFGTERSAKVAWAQPLYEPDEETMSQVKSVFVDGMPPTWEEEKVKEHFGKFGEIERIVLARNMLSAKRKDYGFVNYVERDAALACIDALNNTEIIDGDIKMKVKVVLAKPQLKSKFGKGIRGGYPLGFRGDHRVGTSPGRAGKGCSSGVGTGSYDALSGGNTGRFETQGKSAGVRELEAEKKIVKENENHDEIDFNSQLLQQQAPEGSPLLDPEENKTFSDLEETEGAPLVTSEAEKPSSTIGEIVMKPTLDKFECAMCGFGSDAPDDYEAHKNTKVHRVIEELRKDQKLHNKTPLSLLHEYASRNHFEVNYETKAETNGPFEVIAIIGGGAAAAGGTRTTGSPTKGFGAGRNKARAKQMAAADALEKIMEKVPEFEFTKPGQSRQRFGDRDRPGRKGKGAGGIPGGSGRGGNSGYGNPRARERLNGEWRPTPNSINVPGAPRFAGVGAGRNRRPDGNNLYLSSGGGGNYPSNPNAIPIAGFNNDFPRAGSRSSNYVDRYAGRGGGGGGTGYNSISLRGGRGGMPSHPETYAERYDRIQGGRGYGGGGREYLGGVVGVGGSSYGVRDVGGMGYVGRELPAALGYGGRELHHGGGLGGSSREYEGAGIKRPYAAMEEDARFLDAQRGLPRQRLEALEHVPIQQSGGVQGYGAQSLYSDAARASIVQQPMYTDASRAPVVRPQEQQQYNAYGQQSQGLPVPHNIGQAQHMPTQHLAVQHVPAQHVPSQHIVPAQHISTQHVQTQQHIPTQHVQTQQHIPTQQHLHTQQVTMPITMVGGPGQGGTPYSIYDAAPQATVGVPTGTGQTATHTYSHQYAPTAHNYGGFAINQEYVVNSAVPVQEMAQAAAPYPAQSAYGAQYGVMQQQQVPQQRVGYTLQGATQHQQSYY